jgi:hypothetical protein
MTPEDLAAIPPARLPFPVTRAVAQPVEAEAEGDAMPTMSGYFSTFGDWYEVDSWIEGHFMESVSPRAFGKTIRESRDQMKVLYDHGQDPQIGNKILGPIEELRTDKIGPAYTVPLFDTSYNRDLAPGLKAGVYGSSFRFSVEKDTWDHKPDPSDHNPSGLPERTINEARVYEFGPVTFPANPKATAGARSTTDTFYQRSRDPEQFEALLRSAQVARTSAEAEAAPPSDEPPDDTPEQEPSQPDTPRIEPEPESPAPVPESPPDGGPSDPRSATVEYITREEKASRVTELRASLTTLAAAHPGVMPEDAQSEWDAQTTEMDALERDIAAWDQRQAKLRAFADSPNHTEGPVEAPAIIKRKSDDDIYDVPALIRSARTPEERGSKLRDNALRAIEAMRFVGPGASNQADVKANVSQLVDYGDSEDKEVALRVLNTGSPQYRAAFNRYVKTGGSERAAALAVGVDGTGGFSVPVAFDPTIIAIGAHTTVNPYRSACRVVSITGTDTWQALTSTAIVSAYALEAAAATEQGPTFARPEYIVKRAHSFVTASYEMAQDRADLASELSVLFAESKDNLEEAQFTTGVGTTVFPQGMFLDGAFTALETVGNNVVAVADIYALEAALPIRYRANAAWFFNRSVIHTIAGFETATGHLFNSPNYAAVGAVQQNPGGNTGLRLLGYPVWEVPSASALITTDAAIVGVFADPSNYVIVDRVGMSVKVIPDMLNGATPSFPTGEIGIYAFWRNTARVLNADGGRQLKVNAA